MPRNQSCLYFNYRDSLYNLQHLKAVVIDGGRVSHGSVKRLLVVALNQSFAIFEDLFNFLLNTAEEAIRKLAPYFLLILINNFPHCFKVCKVRRKSIKSDRKSATAMITK